MKCFSCFDYPILNYSLHQTTISDIQPTIKIIEHETKCYVTDKTGTEDYSISKARFVECIEKGEPGFKNISFEEFRKIFSIIEAIKADTK